MSCFFYCFIEREYQCIGQWSGGHVVYAYTRRLDVPTYECFAGAMDINEEIFLKEAGEHCHRNADPYRYGMQMNQTITCAMLLNHHPPSAANTSVTSNSSIVGDNTQSNYANTLLMPPMGIDHPIPNTHNNHSKVNDSTMANGNTVADIARPSMGIGYDYFDENHSNVGTSTEPRYHENDGRNNETVQFVNIKRVNSYGNNEVIDNESDAGDSRTTTHRSSDAKRPGKLPKYDRPAYDYNRCTVLVFNMPLLAVCAVLIRISSFVMLKL